MKKYPYKLSLILIGLMLITNFALTQNIIAYYPFNGNANDESGNGNHGTENGGVAITTDRFGNSNSAYSFDGIDGNIIIPHDASFVPASEITISMWINATNIQSTSFSRIYNKEHAERQLISFQNNGTILAFGLYINGSYQELDVSITPTEYEGSWVHIAATYDGTAKRLYKNGIEIGNATTSGIMGTSNNANIALGSSTGGGEYYNGLLDEVRVYDGALSSSQVVDLYNSDSLIPTITSFSPTNGPIGTEVTITGTNFDTTPANNIVFFGATQASVTAASMTELIVTVPAGSTYQPITVLTNELLAYSSAPFVVTFSGGGTIDANSFDTKADYTTGSAPRSVAIGDIDGDGKADLAVANGSSNTISIFRNTSTIFGSISFNSKEDFPTGDEPYSISIGDLDGDGKPDLVVANNGSNSISIFRNTSTIGVIDANSFDNNMDFPTGSNPRSVSIGDLDGDGKADLVVANWGSHTISVFRNTSTGNGVISYALSLDYPTGSFPRSVAIGDLDGDNKADLAVANITPSTVSVFRNTSTSAGTISFSSKEDFPTGSNPYSVSIGDLDGDGRADLVVANYGNATISVIRNTSTIGLIDANSFDNKVDFPTGSGPFSVSIGNLNGDGKADLAVVNSSSSFTVSVFRNTSTNVGSISYDDKVDFPTGMVPTSVSIADLDNDGKADLVVTNVSSTTLSLFRNTIGSPIISSFSPTSGTVGTEVVITGTTPSAIVSNNTVEFNGTVATISSATTTSLTVTVPVGATTGVITLTVGGQTATSADDFVVIPTVEDLTIEEYYDNDKEPTAIVSLSNVTDINNVELMYKGISEDNNSWETLAVTTDGNTYSATIAANDMIGTEIFFKVAHNGTFELLSDTLLSYLNYPILDNLSGLSFGDQVSDYQIIATPLELENNNVSSVFSSLMPYDIKQWRLYDYANGDNREYNAFNTIDVGKGYWLIVRNSTSISPGAGSVPQVSQDSPFNLTLTPGWNLIGNPYNFRISWQEVLDYNGNYPEIGDLKTFSGGVLNTSTTLDKYRGGFVFNDGNAGIGIDFPVTRNESLGGRIEDETKPSDLSEKYWELTLNLTQGELQNRLGGIGMHPEATLIGKDQFDEVSVPMIKGMGFFELGFEHPEYNAWFNKEVIPTTGSFTWEFDVSRDIDEPLDLSWDNEGFGDNDQQLYLFNPATLEVVDMRNQNNYKIGVAIKALQILFGNKEYINEQLDAAIPLIGEPYPNPTSYQIKYPFKITKGNVKTVSLKVYDYSGKLLGQSVEQYQSGYHQLAWQFDRPGIYLMRLKVGEIIKTNKIIVR